MKFSAVLATLGFGLVLSANAMAAVCGTFTEQQKLLDIDTGIIDCGTSDGSFVVDLPTGVTVKLHKEKLEAGDSCTFSETKHGGQTIVTVTVSLSPDTDESCVLEMTDSSNPRNHAAMTIGTEIDS